MDTSQARLPPAGAVAVGLGCIFLGAILLYFIRRVPRNPGSPHRVEILMVALIGFGVIFTGVGIGMTIGAIPSP